MMSPKYNFFYEIKKLVHFKFVFFVLRDLTITCFSFLVLVL